MVELYDSFVGGGFHLCVCFLNKKVPGQEAKIEEAKQQRQSQNTSVHSVCTGLNVKGGHFNWKSRQIRLAVSGRFACLVQTVHHHFAFAVTLLSGL